MADPQQDWFSQNAPKQAQGGDWFESNAPKAAASQQSTSEPQTPGFFKRVLAPYNPEAEKLGPVGRFLDVAGGSLLGTVPAVYHAFADQPTEEEKKKFGEEETKGLKRVGLGVHRLVVDPVASAAADYASGKVSPGAAASVLPEALGAGVGSMAASEAGGRALSKVGELRTQMSGGGVQPFARKFTGVESELKKAVGKAAEEQGKAEVKHAEATGDVAARQDLAKKVDQSSKTLGEQIEKVEASVAKEANSKFEAVREKLGITKDNPGPEVPPDRLVETVRNIETQTLQNIPEAIKEFRAVLGHGEEASPGMREAFTEATGKEPLGGKPFTWDELQSLKSRLDKRLRNSRGMIGDLKRGLRQLREGVVGEMGAIAEPGGAGDLWADAKNTWRQYREDFHEPTGPSGSGSPVAQALDALDPKNIRQPFIAKQSTIGNRGVDILRKYHQHGGNEAAATAEEMLGHHESLRRMPDKAAPKPLKAPVVDAAQVAREAIARRASRWGDFNARDIGILASSGIGEIVGGIFGANPGVLGGVLTGVGAYEGGKFLAARTLNKPSVIEWLSKTPPEEVAALNKIPGADKVKIINAITEQAISGGGELLYHGTGPEGAAEIGKTGKLGSGGKSIWLTSDLETAKAYAKARGGDQVFSVNKADIDPDVLEGAKTDRKNEYNIGQHMRVEIPVSKLRPGKPVTLSPAAKQFLGPANVARIMGASAGMSTVHNRRDALELMGR